MGAILKKIHLEMSANCLKITDGRNKCQHLSSTYCASGTVRCASSRSVLGSPRASGSLTVYCRGEAPPGSEGVDVGKHAPQAALRPLGRQLLLAATPQHSLQEVHAGLLPTVPRGWNGARTTRGSHELPVPGHCVRQGRADVRAGLHPRLCPPHRGALFPTLSLERGQEPQQTLVSFCCLAWVCPARGRHRGPVLRGCPSPGTGAAWMVRAGGAAGPTRWKAPLCASVPSGWEASSAVSTLQPATSSTLTLPAHQRWPLGSANTKIHGVLNLKVFLSRRSGEGRTCAPGPHVHVM